MNPFDVADVRLFALLAVALVGLIVLASSFRRIGPTEVGLLVKRFSWSTLPNDNPIAWRHEAGYQARLLMPGVRFALWPLYEVQKHPWVQVPAGEIGVVIAQVGQPLPIGAKSAVYRREFGNFSDLDTFIGKGGQKGVQRPVLPPGTLLPIHPVAFLVITKDRIYGVPVSPDLSESKTKLGPASFGLRPEQLELVRIRPVAAIAGGISAADAWQWVDAGAEAKHATAPADTGVIDILGIVTTYEGDPLPSGTIASRLGDFKDIAEAEANAATTDADLIECILGNKNAVHNNYQDFQAFLDGGGRIGLQHDPLLYGAYALNPFLVSVERVPMLVVRQGEVAVVKAYVGLATQDTSGSEFKFGSLVRPGHRGIWQESLRTGKYPINPRCYQAEIVPTAILTLNWSNAVSAAHNLDRGLSQIVAKSREGFVFSIDLQVQIHVGDTRAPRVISMVATMQNLVNEVLQGAVGNHFRDTLQGMKAIEFIETRQQVQVAAFQHISEQLQQYQVETKGVLIQDVVLPKDLVEVLTQRELAVQEKQTYESQQAAQVTRLDLEKAKGQADMQADLAKSEVGKDIASNKATAREAEGHGEAAYIRETGSAKGAEVEAIGLARAKGFEAQRQAIGEGSTALVNALGELARGQRFVPETLVMGGNGGGGVLEALATAVIKSLNGKNGHGPVATTTTAEGAGEAQ